MKHEIEILRSKLAAANIDQEATGMLKASVSQLEILCVKHRKDILDAKKESARFQGILVRRNILIERNIFAI
jgi:hypothetical protein